MSGFKKCGVYPLNPREVMDRQLVTSKAVCPQPGNSNDTNAIPSSPLLLPEQEALYQHRFKEHYDIRDPSYMVWLKINPTEVDVSVTGTSSEESSSYSKQNSDKAPILLTYEKNPDKVSSSSDVLSELLVLHTL